MYRSWWTAFPRSAEIRITYKKIEGANHFFDNCMPEVVEIVADYVKNRMESPYGGR